MITALLAALLLTSPIQRPELQRCVTSCNWATDVCFYELKTDCGRAQVCVDTDAIQCKPLRVYLFDVAGNG